MVPFLGRAARSARVATAVAALDALELEDAANAQGLPICVVRDPRRVERAHEQGAFLAGQPVIGLERIGDAPPCDSVPAARPFDGVRVLSFTHAVAGPTVGRTLAEQGADVLCATRPNDYEHEFIYAEANVGSRSAYIDLDHPVGRERAGRLLEDADVVVENYRLGSLERRGLSPRRARRSTTPDHVTSRSTATARRPMGGAGRLRHERVGRFRPHDGRGVRNEPRLPVTSLINDYITGYMGAIGASAALVKRATEGGSWHVTVSLTRSAMWCGSLGFVDPALAGCDEEHSLREPNPYDAATPFGPVHMLAPPVHFSHTPAAWTDPILVPRGSSRPAWRS